MNKIKKQTLIQRSFLMILLFLGLTALGQEESQVYINPADPAFIEKYKNVDFDGKFAVSPVSDNANNYYMVDFSKLASKFEKVYFLNLIFKGGEAVNIDGDLSKDRIWFLSNRKYSTKDIFILFDQLKAKAEKANSSFTEQEKSAWMKSNDKY
jgi:hypothetical protein